MRQASHFHFEIHRSRANSGDTREERSDQERGGRRHRTATSGAHKHYPTLPLRSPQKTSCSDNEHHSDETNEKEKRESRRIWYTTTRADQPSARTRFEPPRNFTQLRILRRELLQGLRTSGRVSKVRCLHLTLSGRRARIARQTPLFSFPQQQFFPPRGFANRRDDRTRTCRQKAAYRLLRFEELRREILSPLSLHFSAFLESSSRAEETSRRRTSNRTDKCRCNSARPSRIGAGSSGAASAQRADLTAPEQLVGSLLPGTRVAGAFCKIVPASKRDRAGFIFQ